MSDVLKELEKVIAQRRETPEPGSYTAYLFEKGLDKILKKVGEECAETIIAAKNGVAAETAGEMADLVYHLMVLMNELDIPLDSILDVLGERAKKTGNLKPASGEKAPPRHGAVE